ncbi:putative reverse transcriptase domain-containing protein [Tanacetum coccineum]|uniref:Reverse transcriptase domain-containing protein n=1 Tax=Tanacetum coccineum TaxID=301880 RepID=A0ABQ5ECI2_9ASTR
MPPRRMKKKSVKRLVEKHVAKAIEEYEKTRANLSNVGGSRKTNAGGTINVQGCSYKTFMKGKPHSFNGTEGVVGLRRWIEKVEQVFEIFKWLINANRILWTEFKTMMTTKYCLATEIQRIEQELWTLTLKGDDIEAYNNRFLELALMCPELVCTENKKVERYICGFPERIKGNLTSSKPTTMHDAINMARELVEQAVQVKAARIGESNKRKWEEYQTNTNNNNPNNNRKRNNNHHQQQNRRQETARAYAAALAEGRGYARNLPRTGHQEKDYRARLPGAGVTPLQDVTCYGCGEKGHYKDKCPKGRNQQNEGARGRAYVVVENLQQNPNVVTGTFLLNNHYACILFDSCAEKSFVSSAFTPFIDITPAALNTSYEVELTDGKVVSTNTILRSCTLVLVNHVFKIDLLPTRLGSFDVIIGMDWLAYHRAVIDYYEKIVRIPLPNGEILEFQGERPKKDPGSLACIKADEKKLDDIRVIRDFPEVFLDDLSGLPPVREIEFRIDLIPGALLVVKSPYRLAPSEMLELSCQLKELQEKGFLRPSDKQDEAFRILKEKLCNAPVLALPDGPNDFVVYCDASKQGFGIMPPRRMKKKSVKRLVEKRVAKAIEEYEKTRANLSNAGGSGTTNAGGTVNVQGCSHKTFRNGKPHSFNGTEGVVGLRRWIEKVEQVFEICKCAEEDKVMFAASTFEGRALT